MHMLEQTHRKEAERQPCPLQNCPGLALQCLSNGFNTCDWQRSWQIPLVQYSVGHPSPRQCAGAVPKQTPRLQRACYEVSWSWSLSQVSHIWAVSGTSGLTPVSCFLAQSWRISNKSKEILPTFYSYRGNQMDVGAAGQHEDTLNSGPSSTTHSHIWESEHLANSPHLRLLTLNMLPVMNKGSSRDVEKLLWISPNTQLWEHEHCHLSLGTLWQLLVP